MSIKERIGSRITESRKELGITIKELAKRTEEYSAARINNWELGSRSPGPVEAKVLSKVLGVSPAYLLCLSDSPRGDSHLQKEILPRYAPLLPLQETKMGKDKLKVLIEDMTPYSDQDRKIPLYGNIKESAGPLTFATTIESTSMSPEFNPGDIVIADPSKKPKPGQYVIAHIKESDEVVVRKYRENGTSASTSGKFELVATNPDWGLINIQGTNDGIIFATITLHIKNLTRQ